MQSRTRGEGVDWLLNVKKNVPIKSVGWCLRAGGLLFWE
jgi:hypothetical protein